MAALAAARLTDVKYLDRGHELNMPVSNVKVYKGGLVAVNGSGYLVAASDAANLKVVGIALEDVDNSGGSAGDKKCKVLTGVAVRLPASSITQAMVGTKQYVVDDQTFDDATGTNSIEAGVLIEFISTTEGWLYIPPFFMNLL